MAGVGIIMSLLQIGHEYVSKGECYSTTHRCVSNLELFLVLFAVKFEIVHL